VLTVKGLVAALLASIAPIFHVINLLIIFIFIFGTIAGDACCLGQGHRFD